MNILCLVEYEFEFGSVLLFWGGNIRFHDDIVFCLGERESECRGVVGHQRRTEFHEGDGCEFQILSPKCKMRKNFHGG